MQEQDLARIRLVTRRYGELQGLGRCALGIGLMAGGLVADQVLDTTTAWWAFLLPALAAGSIAIPGKLAADRLYERRFGRVRHGGDVAGAAWRRGLWIGVGVTVLLLVEERFAGPGYPSLLLLAMALVPAHTLLQDWPLRKYLLLEVIAAVVASALYVTAEVPGSRVAYQAMQYAFWWKGLGLIGLAALMTGMLDHRLLMHTLRGVRESDPECEHADPV